MTKKICKKAGFRDDSSLLRYSSSKNPVAKKARHDEDINDENSHSKNVDLNKKRLRKSICTFLSRNICRRSCIDSDLTQTNES